MADDPLDGLKLDDFGQKPPSLPADPHKAVTEKPKPPPYGKDPLEGLSDVDMGPTKTPLQAFQEGLTMPVTVARAAGMGVMAGPGQAFLSLIQEMPHSDELAGIFGFSSMADVKRQYEEKVHEKRQEIADRGLGKGMESALFHFGEALPFTVMPALGPEKILGSRVAGSVLKGAEIGGAAGLTEYLEPGKSRTQAALFGTLTGGLTGGVV